MRTWPSLSISLLALVALGCTSGDESDKDSKNDTEVSDSGKVDTDTDTDTDTNEETPLTLAIDDVPLDPVEHGSLTQLVGHITGWTAETELIWLSETEGELSRPVPDADGTLLLDLTGLPPGWHSLTLRATRGEEVVDYAISLGLCEESPLETFGTSPDPSLWSLYGNAYWDANGWIEITGVGTGSAGQIFKTDRAIDPGNFTVSFDIATGGGINGGADGFALSVWDVPNPTALEELLGKTQNGGCLGYGLSNGCGSAEYKGFHIEFDTWHNNGDPITDPTSSTHIGILLNGDASSHYLWAAVPSLEDLKWRAIRVEIEASYVTVFMDGTSIMEGDISGFIFEGGYLGVSGSTGWASNYHRFDNLNLEGCVVP
jgi:hypothetical protein